jgi:hypothetical protein
VKSSKTVLVEILALASCSLVGCGLIVAVDDPKALTPADTGVADHAGDVEVARVSDAAEAGGDQLARDADIDRSVEGDTHDAGVTADASDGRPVVEPPETGDVKAEAGPPDATDILPPKLIAPLSTATATTRRPKFRWVLPEGTTGAHVQICLDNPCAHELATLDVSGTSGMTTVDLPRGVVFWRAWGTAGGVTGKTPSPTWQFTVGARTTPIDSSWGTTLDVNNDKLADVVVGAPGVNDSAGEVYVYLGAIGSLSSIPATTLRDMPPTIEYGWSVASAGDVNGDGYADVIVGAMAADNYAGRAYLYFGGPSGLSNVPAVTLKRPNGGAGSFGISVASAGDVNGDGYADVIVGAIGDSDAHAGQAHIYLGRPSGPSTSPSFTIRPQPAFYDSFGYSVAGACDVNGDGYADVIVGARTDAGEGQAYVFLGGQSGVSSTPVASYHGPGAPSEFGGSVACAGDINADGYADIVIGAAVFDSTYSGGAYVYLGGSSGPSATGNLTIKGPDSYGHFGVSVTSAGDLSGDGYSDLVIGADQFDKAFVYPGSASGPSNMPNPAINSPDPGTGQNRAFFGHSVAGAGDLDGDGFLDVVIGSHGVKSGWGRVYVYRGSLSGLSPTPALALDAPAGAYSMFGFSVY